MDIRDYNRRAWNRAVESKNRWTVPVSSETIESARRGEWEVVLTPSKAVPREWFAELRGSRVLALASAGGQQAPLLAAAGATVTVFDNSPGQLAQDRAVAERDGLALELVEGDMRDLSCFANESFDLIFHPCSNGFVPEILPVWREAYRVLRPGGLMLAGFCNPIMFIFDARASERGELIVRHRIPYSDATDLTSEELAELVDTDEPLSFGHTLQDQIGGQLDAGFVLDRMFEDAWDEEDALSRYIASFVATRARRPAT